MVSSGRRARLPGLHMVPQSLISRRAVSLRHGTSFDRARRMTKINEGSPHAGRRRMKDKHNMFEVRYADGRSAYILPSSQLRRRDRLLARSLTARSSAFSG